jgi:drug/metabolite transporter (DMT)-like permease
VTLTASEAAAAPARARRLGPPLLLAGGVLAASVALHLRDPHRSGSWGYCPWLLLTGTYCPGCGGLRAVNDLTRGDVGAAFSSNALFVASIPAFAALWVRSVRRRWRGVNRPWPSRVVAVSATLALVAVLVFWVVRNLPAASWLTP